MKSPTSVVVQLLLDVPMMQRSKQYYLKKIEEFFQNCKQPAGMYIHACLILRVHMYMVCCLISFRYITFHSNHAQSD